MAELADLLKQARALGLAIAENPKVKAYLEAQAAVRDDAEARRLLDTYQQAATRVQQLSAERKPIEPELKRTLAESEQKMASQASLKRLMRAQADYFDLMNRINNAMEEPLQRPAGGSAEQPAPAAPSA